MPIKAAGASGNPAQTHPAIVAISSTAGIAKASITAFVPFTVSVLTVTFCPTAKRDAALHFTSISFSLLSVEEQYDATLHALHALLWVIRTLTISPEMLSMMPGCDMLLHIVCFV